MQVRGKRIYLAISGQAMANRRQIEILGAFGSKKSATDSAYSHNANWTNANMQVVELVLDTPRITCLEMDKHDSPSQFTVDVLDGGAVHLLLASFKEGQASSLFLGGAFSSTEDAEKARKELDHHYSHGPKGQWSAGWAQRAFKVVKQKLNQRKVVFVESTPTETLRQGYWDGP